MSKRRQTSVVERRSRMTETGDHGEPSG
jgi:hypothetical protein